MASIIDDYLTSSPDPLTPDGGGGGVVYAPFESTTTKDATTTVRSDRPKYTESTTITPESQTIANQTGGTQNWSETQKVINTDYKPETRDEFATRTGAKAVMERLQMQRPQPTGDPERMRKIAGVQAVGEALRNVVDAVYGVRKAKIDPHRSYTDNLLKQANNMDSTYAGQLKEYFKTLNDAEKKLTDDYLRKLMSEKDVAYNSKTIGGSNKTGQTITTTPEKIVTTLGKQTGGGSVSTQIGGTTHTTGTRPMMDSGGGAGDENKKVIGEIKFPDGSVRPLIKRDLNVAFTTAIKNYNEKLSPRGEALRAKMVRGEKLDDDEKFEFVQENVNVSPSIAKEAGDILNIPETQRGTGRNVNDFITTDWAERTDYGQEETPSQTNPNNTPISKEMAEKNKKLDTEYYNRIAKKEKGYNEANKTKPVNAFKNKSIKGEVNVPKVKKTDFNFNGVKSAKIRQ